MQQQEEDNINEYIGQIEHELQQATADKRQLANAQASLFGTPIDENLIKWQLDLQQELDRIYYLLRGFKKTIDKDGNEQYIEPEDADLKPFNEFGTQIIMNVIQFYVNKNTILSNYKEDTINYKVLDFGNRLSDLIHNRYEEMMMTTSFENEFKKIYDIDLIRMQDGKFYYSTNILNTREFKVMFKKVIGKELIHSPRGLCVEIISGSNKLLQLVPQTLVQQVINYFGIDSEEEVLSEIDEVMIKSVDNRINEHLLGKMKMCDILGGSIVDSVHSAYNRALNGGERGSLREARTVTQNITPNYNPNFPIVSNKKPGMLNRIRGMT